MRKGENKFRELVVSWKKKKQGIYCQGQKDDVDGFPSLHPIYRLVVAGIVQQKNNSITYINIVHFQCKAQMILSYKRIE